MYIRPSTWHVGDVKGVMMMSMMTIIMMTSATVIVTTLFTECLFKIGHLLNPLSSGSQFSLLLSMRLGTVLHRLAHGCSKASLEGLVVG